MFAMVNTTTKIMRVLILSFCIFGLLISSAWAQKTNSTPKIEKSEKINFVSKGFARIERLNNILLDEKAKLSNKERTFFFANLAKIWKDENFKVAKDYLKKAVDEATPLLNDDPKDKTQKTEWLRKLLLFSGQIDLEATHKIIKLLESISKEGDNQKEPNSKALLEASLAVIEINPKLGFDLAVAALSLLEKPSDNEAIQRIIFSLALKDKKLAENLLLRVLEFARNTSDSKTFDNLASFTSPKSFTVQVDFLSDGSKRNVLSAFLGELLRFTALFQQNQLFAEQKEQACSFLLKGKALEPIIGTYLPDKSALVSQISQQYNLCQQASSLSNTQAVFDGVAANKKDLSVEELVKAASETTDTGKKAFYLHLAIRKLSKEKEFEKALNLLDGMDEETKKALGIDNNDGYWIAERHDVALDAVSQKLKAKDFGSANRIIEKTPSDLRPMLQIAVSRDILEKVSAVDFSDPEQTFAFSLIADARQKLPNIDDPFSSVNLYLPLLQRYAVLLPNEITLIFRETVKAINRADDAKDKKENQDKDYYYGRDVVLLPVSLLEKDENTIFNQIEDIQKPYSRVRIKLGLLNASMVKYREEKKQIEQEKARRQPSKI